MESIMGQDIDGNLRMSTMHRNRINALYDTQHASGTTNEVEGVRGALVWINAPRAKDGRLCPQITRMASNIIAKHELRA